MNIQTYNVKLNMKDTGIVETGIRLKQGDSKMQFIFTIIDGGESYFDIDDLPKVCFKRPDGTTVLGTSQISENNYIYQIVGNELQIAGNVLCDVKFTLIDGRESTSTFQFDVLPDTVTNNAEGSGVYDNDLADTVQEIRDLQAEVNRVARVATDTVNEARQAVETTSDSVILAQSYAKGGTGARAGEDTDNAKYYYEKAKTVTGIGTGDLIIKQNGIYAGTFNANSMTDVEIDLLGGGGTGVVGWGSIQGDISDQTDLVQSLADIDSKIYSYVTDMEERGFYSPNMFSHSFATQTQYGITYTANDDKSITINGTSTASTPVVIGSFKFESGKSYILNGCPNVVGCSLVVGTTSYSDAGTGVTIVGDGNTYNISLSVTSGTVVTNAVVKPMIRMSDIKDDTYYPYILSNTELVNAVPTGLLPEVYITTESDATITVSNSSTSLTPTKLDATTWKVTVPSFGDWDIHSINSLGDIKQTLTVDSIKVYQITITHFTAYITVNYTAGAVLTLTNGGTTITATVSGQKITVHQKGIWTVTATFDAQTSQSKTVNISTECEEKTVTLDAFATLNVNYDAVYIGETVTLTNGTKTYTKSATSSLSVQFVVDVFGTWSVTTSKTSQSVEMPTKGTYSLILSEGDRHIIVTYESAFEGAEITCTNGSVTKSQTASGGTIGFYFDQDGTYTISGEASGTTYSTSVEVNGAGEYTANLQTTITVTFDVYSAVNDTVYYIEDGSNVTLCTTGADGKGSASLTILPTGETLTLYSTVAKDTTSGSSAYSQSVTITSSTTGVKLMPSGTNYWYGYNDGVFGGMVKGTDGSGSVTFSTNSILLSTTTGANSIIYTNNTVNTNYGTQMKFYIKWTTTPDTSNQTGYSTTKTNAQTTSGATSFNTNGIHATNITSGRYYYTRTWDSTLNIYAVWSE